MKILIDGKEVRVPEPVAIVHEVGMTEEQVETTIRHIDEIDWALGYAEDDFFADCDDEMEFSITPAVA